MTLRSLTIAGLLTMSLAADQVAEARYTLDDRRSIRATPIMERPSRPGHFYGNTVRRTHERTGGMMEGMTE